MTEDARRIVDAQVDYYRARAPEYDDYYTRTGQCDAGPEANAEWLNELDEATRALELDELAGDVLEIAAGTGWWTAQLAERANTVTAIDAAAETLAINATRRRDRDNVTLIETDVFAFEPSQQFDAVFFGFWLTHVPFALFDEFWSRVSQWLQSDGKAVFIDNLESSAPSIQARPEPNENELMRRTLKDGRQFTIVKTVWTPETLRARLEPTWQVTAGTTQRFFLYGKATPR